LPWIQQSSRIPASEASDQKSPDFRLLTAEAALPFPLFSLFLQQIYSKSIIRAAECLGFEASAMGFNSGVSR